MCTECGGAIGIHFESCSQYTELSSAENEQQARGAEVLYDMVKDRMEVSLFSIAEAQFKDTMFKSILSDAAITQMAKNTVWQIMNEENFDITRIMSSMHMLAILIENDIINEDKLEELLVTLGWSAPDAIG